MFRNWQNYELNITWWGKTRKIFFLASKLGRHIPPPLVVCFAFHQTGNRWDNIVTRDIPQIRVLKSEPGLGKFGLSDRQTSELG